MIDPEEYRQLQWEKRLKKSAIPRRFWDLRLDKLDQSPAVEKVAAYVDHLEEHREAGRGLLLLGDPGRGKTTLACVTGLHAFERKFSSYYTTIADYRSLLLEEQSLSSAVRLAKADEELMDEWLRKRAIIDRIKHHVVFLIVDDMGKEHSTTTRFIEDEIDQLLRSRFDLGLPTIITTNVRKAHWAEHYSESMASFIHEACVMVAVDGEDRRRKR